MKTAQDYQYWQSEHKNDNYFDCGKDYTNDLKNRFFSSKHLKRDEYLVSMSLKDGKWGQAYNSTTCFRAIEDANNTWDVLEIGCGYGAVGALLALFCSSYTGIDIADEIVRKGNKAIEEANIPNMRLLAAPDSKIPQLDKKFDLVFSTGVFIHTPIEATVYYLNNTAKLLKPGGFFIHHLNVSSSSTVDISMNKVFNIGEADKIFDQAGLIIQRKFDGLFYRDNRFMRYYIGTAK